MTQKGKWLTHPSYEKNSLTKINYFVWKGEEDDPEAQYLRLATDDEILKRAAPKGHHLRSDGAVFLLSGGRIGAHKETNSGPVDNFAISLWQGPAWGEDPKAMVHTTFINLQSREDATALINAMIDARDVIWPPLLAEQIDDI